MSESDARSQDEVGSSPHPNSGATPPGDLSVGGGTCHARVGGGKTVSVFGALFGAAAAVPT